MTSAPEAVQCSVCGAAAQMKARALAIAVCGGCSRVLDVAPLFGQQGAAPTPAARAPRVPMPLTAALIDLPGDWHLEVPHAVAGARWMKIVGGFVSLVAALLTFVPGSPIEVRAASVLMLALAGYTFFQGVVNRMRLFVREGAIDLSWGPWPWLDGGTRISNVAKLEVVRELHQTDEEGTRFEFSWSLWATRRDGSRKQLLEHFDDPFFPLWLHQQLTDRLAASPKESPKESP